MRGRRKIDVRKHDRFVFIARQNPIILSWLVIEKRDSEINPFLPSFVHRGRIKFSPSCSPDCHKFLSRRIGFAEGAKTPFPWGTSDASLSGKGRLMDSRNGNSKGIERTRKRVASRHRVSPETSFHPLCSILDGGKVNFSKKTEMKRKKKKIYRSISPSETARSVEDIYIYNKLFVTLFILSKIKWVMNYENKLK